MKKVLTIAGSDSGGGAGIQADLKTITVLGAYGSSVITALTAQNTVGVRGVHVVPVDFIRQQMEAVLSDIGADAAKTGMLANTDVVRTVAGVLKSYRVPNLVVDPVMVAASGDPLLSPHAVEALKSDLLPLAAIVTPNLSEAAALAGFPVENPEDMRQAAKAIHEFGPGCVLIKGGHLKDRALDVLFDGKSFTEFEAARIETPHTHGTGCTLSAALAVFLAQGLGPAEAVHEAKTFITEAILSAFSLGSGRGPTNHFIRVFKLQQRETVLRELKTALERLLLEPIGALIPEIRSNLGYALPAAVDVSDVAAVPGRITQIGERLMVCSQPAFGASRHIAKVILAAMKHDQEMRSAMNIRFNQNVLSACNNLGLSSASFDRAEEPPEIKEKEGSSLEWGTGRALSGLTGMPDLIYDLGEVGKEPVIRVLGRNPMQVVEKVINIGRELGR